MARTPDADDPDAALKALTLDELRILIRLIERDIDTGVRRFNSQLVILAWLYLARFEREWGAKQQPRAEQALKLDRQLMLFWVQSGHPRDWLKYPSLMVSAVRNALPGDPMFKLTDRSLTRAFRRAHERYMTSADFCTEIEQAAREAEPVTKH